MGRGPNVPPFTYERALDMWASMPDRSGVDIAVALGISHSALCNFLYRSLTAGDARATPRKGGRRPSSKNKPRSAAETEPRPVRIRQRRDPRRNGPNSSRGIYRTQEVSRALKDDVLNSWAEGLDGAQIALKHGVSVEYVHNIIQRARKENDPRAIGRRRANRFLGCTVALKDAVHSLSSSGIELDDIALIVGVTRKRAQEVLSRAS